MYHGYQATDAIAVLAVLVIGLLFAAACGAGSAMILSRKGQSGCAGFALGFLLGPIGLIVALVLPAKVR